MFWSQCACLEDDFALNNTFVCVAAGCRTMPSALRVAPTQNAQTHPPTPPMPLAERAGARASGSPRSADILLNVSTV